MKDRLKKFWEQEKERVYYYAGGFGMGLATGLVFYLDAKGKNVENMTLHVDEEEHRALVTLTHKNGLETCRPFHKRVV